MAMANLLLGDTCSYKSRVQTTIWAVQLLLLSVGIISTVLVLKGAVIPYSLDVLLSTIPSLWTSFRSWLSPLYIYIILNFIIITIAASSTFHHQKHHTHDHHDKNDDDSYTASPPPPPPQQNKQTHFQDSTRTTPPPSSKTTSHSLQTWQDIQEQSTSPPPSDQAIEKSTAFVENSIIESLLEMCQDISPSINSGENDHLEYQSTSPLVFTETTNNATTTTTENHRKPVAGEKKQVGVAKTKNEDEDTLEATWKAITEGGGKPVSRQLKKSDTWDAPPRVEESLTVSSLAAWRELRKSETFNDAVSATQRGRLRRDASLSHDELNHRVEAFIKKFNQEMRLQRQESDQRFLEMINRGV